MTGRAGDCCGSRAKPILLELERVSGIKEAWLNRGGTQLAVVWSDSRPSGERMETLATVLKSHELTATELKRSERARALRRFQSGRDWYRADAMDRLSEEEAGIIAAQLLRRVQSKTPLPEAKATMLRSAMTTH